MEQDTRANPARASPPTTIARVRFVAVDLGDARTGLAAGDDATRIVTPLEVLEVPWRERDGEALLAALATAIDTHLGRGGEIVVGLPLNMDGSEGPQAAKVRTFASRLGERTSRPVHLFDERLSSVQADWQMARSGLTRDDKKKRRDARAAAVILQDFLSQLPPSGTSKTGW